MTLDASHLSSQQQEELTQIVPPDLFQERPGFTTVVEHFISLNDTTPVCQYRVPEHLLPSLKAEVEDMLALGVSEVSEWSNPVVLVPKKDDAMRFCIDFRHINAQSKFDAHPVPQLEDLKECLGQASYITTLDLCYLTGPFGSGGQALHSFSDSPGIIAFRPARVIPRSGRLLLAVHTRFCHLSVPSD